MLRVSEQIKKEEDKKPKPKGVSFVMIGECKSLHYITVETPKPIKS
jgi:hypothetical protein